jgi:hypothetical protein
MRHIARSLIGRRCPPFPPAAPSCRVLRSLISADPITPRIPQQELRARFEAALAAQQQQQQQQQQRLDMAAGPMADGGDAACGEAACIPHHDHIQQQHEQQQHQPDSAPGGDQGDAAGARGAQDQSGSPRPGPGGAIMAEGGKVQICYDFTKGMCTRGDKCKYSHDIATIVHFNSREKGICFDYLRNQCHRGLLCRFSHDLSNIAQQCQVRDGWLVGWLVGRLVGAVASSTMSCSSSTP